MDKKIYLLALQLAVGTALYAQSPVLSNVTSNPGANLNSTADDFIQFNLKPTAPTPFYADPYTYTLTATQNGNPVAVTLQSGTAATNVKYFADGYTPGFKLANGTAGNGNVIITVTPNWGNYPASIVTLVDPGSNINNVCGTKTATYSYQSDRDNTDFYDLLANIPKFNATAGKTLLQTNVEVALDIFSSNFLENISSGAQPGFRYKLDLAYSNLNLNGNSIISSSNQTVYQTPNYPSSYPIPANVPVPASGTWVGDSILANGMHSTLSRMKGPVADPSWLTKAQFVGLDATLDPRWVEHQVGNTTGALVADMYIVPPSTYTITDDVIFTNSNPDFNQFIGTGNVPLTFNTLVSINSIGGGGNLIGNIVTTGAFTVKVTYTYTDVCLNLSGNVYNDGNGNTNQLVNHTYNTGTGIGNPDGTALFANLIDANGKVIATTSVNASTGAYMFNNITGDASYTVQISTHQGTVGNTAPVTALPSNWRNTGEQISTTTGVDLDASIDGRLSINMTDVDLTNVNFGINKIPNADVKSYSFNTVPATGTLINLDGTNSTYGASPGLLSGMDREDGAKGGSTSKFVITSLPTYGVLKYWNGTSTINITAADVANGTVFTNPANLRFEFSSPNGPWTNTVFHYAFVDDAGMTGTSNTYSIKIPAAEPLSVDLVYFNAIAQGCDAILNWRTENEKQFSHFEIEYAQNNQSFEKVGSIKAGQKAYTFNYSQKDGNAIYRLKMLDFDGAFSYSETVKVRTTCEQNGIEIYPNPARESITINGLKTGSSITIMNVLGQSVFTLENNTLSLENININHLNEGLYNIIIQNGTERNVFKIIKK